MFESKKSLASAGVKSSIVYTLSSLFSKGLAIITLPIFTRLMSSSEIGVVNLYNSWYSMISVVATLSLTSGGFQLALKEFKDKRDSYVSSVLTLTSGMALLVGAIYIVAPNFWNSLTHLTTPLMLLMVAELFLSPAQSFWLARQRYEYKYKLVAVVTFSSALVASVVSVFAVVSASKSGYENLGEIRLFANYAVLLTYALIIWAYIYAKGKTVYNKTFWKFSLSLSVPLIGNSIAAQVLSVADRTMISHMVNNSAVGIYSTLYTVSSISLLVWQAINASFIPFLYENIDKRHRAKDIRSLSTKLLAAFSAVAFLMTLFAPEIVKILATDEYYEAIYIMPPIAAGVFLTSVSNMYSNLLIYHKKTKFIMISSITAAALNVVLNYFGIKAFGYMAAAYTTLFAYIVLAVMQGIVATHIHKALSERESMDIYNTKLIVLMCFGSIVLCLCCLLLYRLSILRYVILGVALISGFVMREKIKVLIRK